MPRRRLLVPVLALALAVPYAAACGGESSAQPQPVANPVAETDVNVLAADVKSVFMEDPYWSDLAEVSCVPEGDSHFRCLLTGVLGADGQPIYNEILDVVVSPDGSWISSAP